MSSSSTCQICNKEFSPKNYWQKFCSNVCKQANWAIKKTSKENWVLYAHGEVGNIKMKDSIKLDDLDIFQVKVSFYSKPVNRLYRAVKDKITKGDNCFSDSTPDLDNAVKPILDSFTGKIWKNDRKVCRLIVEKFYSEEEKTIIKIDVLR